MERDERTFLMGEEVGYYDGAYKVSRARYMSAGALSCPIVFRGPGGAVQQLGAQHSNSFEGMYANCPGLKVMMPATSKDAKGMLKTAIRDDNPVVFIESEAMYGVKGEVPVPTCIKAAEVLKSEGINAEVLDLRSIRPLDEEAIFRSVRKTNKAIVVHEASPVASIGAWLASYVTEQMFDYLDAPVRVISAKDFPFPYSKSLEKGMCPEPEDIIRFVKQVA
ncbi:UNVERIFIED_CONTAM: hypothetical protein GTU68_004699 [Idotea baltica]|nr:hypothetical protein [Idotea baltica]